MNIYVGNLPFNATEDEVRALFAEYGQVTSVALITDKMTGRPRGFGFVEMSSDGEAQAAMDALNGQDFKGRTLVINPARPRDDSGPRQGGGFQDRRGPSRDNRSRREAPRRKDSW